VKVVNPAAMIEKVAYERVYGLDFDDMNRRKPQLRRLFELTGFKPNTSLAAIIEMIARSDMTL
jgi:hypothetical protein